MMTTTVNCVAMLTVVSILRASSDFNHDLASKNVNCYLPYTLHAEVTSSNQSLVLRLVRNPDVDPSASVFLLTGEAVLEQHRTLHRLNRAEYQDTNHMATVEVTCTNKEDGSSSLSLSGLVSMSDGRLYTFDPRFSRDKTRTTEDSYADFDPFHLDYAVLDYNTGAVSDVAADPSCPRPDGASAAPDVHLDIVVLVDYTVYQRWYNRSTRSGPEKRKLDTVENIQGHFGHLMNAVHLRFKMASPRYHLHLAGYVIETSVSGDLVCGDCGSTRTDVEGRWLLDSAWALASRTSGFPANDHVIMFTERTLYTVQEGRYTEILGIAYDGRMCHPHGYSISLTRYRDSLVDDVIAAAHEIGHSLGAPHDTMHSSCTSSENYIMSGAHEAEGHVTQNNQYTFSACSVRSFEKHVTLLEARSDSSSLSCLYDTIQPLSVSFLLPSLPGVLHDVHKQCQMLYSASSFFCHVDIGGSENVCIRMPCYNPRTRRCVFHKAGEGTPCGNRKWCIAGACVHSTDAPAKHADCVFGNRPGPVYQGKDCDQTLGSKRHLCYSQRNRQVCCDTCLKMATGPPGCEYGNNYWNISSCSPDKCGEPGSQYSRQCCDTCQIAPATSATTTPDLHTSSTTKTLAAFDRKQVTSSNMSTVNGNTSSVPPTPSEYNVSMNSTDSPAQEASSFTVPYDDASMGFSSVAPATTEGSFISAEPKLNISSTEIILPESNVETTPKVTNRTDEVSSEALVKSYELVQSREPPTTSKTHATTHIQSSTPFPPSVNTSSATSETTDTPLKSSSTRYLNRSPTAVSPTVGTVERGLSQSGVALYGDCVDVDGLYGSSKVSCTAETIATPSKCYDIAYYKKCCSACRVFHTNVTGCEFGDRDLDLCLAIDRLSCCDHRPNCCATCQEDTQPLMCGYGTGSSSPRHALIVIVLSLGMLI